ncbi:MAG: helix-turn-helix domain-containing protein, partial [Proteobacteria bacterium]|nr:helix-turn-helix domain-containing protein [Pseudomonadota bacterium]
MTDSVQSEQDINPLDICGFDDFPLLLGDIMRGERATLGKSLEQAAAEIKIREPLLQAIESCDTTAFASPSFISGNVR